MTEDVRGKKPLLWYPALNYYMAIKAHEMSFLELYNDISKYIPDNKKRFKFVTRVKRGLTDTS